MTWDEGRKDDLFWRSRERGPEYAEYAQARGALASAGLRFLYGGHKGHGFWVDGWVRLSLRDLKTPDPGPTGNPHFFTCEECVERAGLVMMLRADPELAGAVEGVRKALQGE